MTDPLWILFGVPFLIGLGAVSVIAVQRWRARRFAVEWNEKRKREMQAKARHEHWGRN